jgi:hypothetical protein
MSSTNNTRNYCFFLDGSKYNRNIGCKAHDNAYGVKGGGTESQRKKADLTLLAHMRANNDPVAEIAYAFVRLYGWAFFNYHGRPWQGQLIRRLFRSRH